MIPEKNSAESTITPEQRAQHLNLTMARVRAALQDTPYGCIKIELRGPDRPIDVVIESRERVPVPQRIPV